MNNATNVSAKFVKDLKLPDMEKRSDFLEAIREEVPFWLTGLVFRGAQISMASMVEPTIKITLNKPASEQAIKDILGAATKEALWLNQGANDNSFGLMYNIGIISVLFLNGKLHRDETGVIQAMKPPVLGGKSRVLSKLDMSISAHAREYYSRYDPNDITLDWFETENIEQVAKALGFACNSKENSEIHIDVDGGGKCPVKRMCIRPEEYLIGHVLSAILDTHDTLNMMYRNGSINEAPLISFTMPGGEIRVSRDRREIEMQFKQQFEPRKAQKNRIIDFVLGALSIEIEDLRGAEIRNLRTYGEIGSQVLESVTEKIRDIAKTIGSPIISALSSIGNPVGSALSSTGSYFESTYNEHESKVVQSVSISLVPVMLALLMAFGSTNGFNEAIIVTSIALVSAIVFRAGKSLLSAPSQKRFPILFWSGVVMGDLMICYFGFKGCLEIIAVAIAAVALVVIAAWLLIDILYPTAIRVKDLTVATASPIATSIGDFLKPISLKYFDEKTVSSIAGFLSLVAKAILVLVGILLAIWYTVLIIPALLLSAWITLFTPRYWKQLNEYRDDAIQFARNKHREERELPPDCFVIFSKTNCKLLRNPFAGTVKVLSRKIPNILTMSGYKEMFRDLVTGEWI